MAKEFLLATWEVLIALAPWLLLGALIAGVLHVVVPDRWLGRALAGRAGVFKAVAFGVPLPLCSCGVIPAGISLKKRGASDGAAMGFLISTPQTGVDSVMVSAGMLGWPFALFKVVAAGVLGVVGGLLAGSEASTPSEATQGQTSRRTFKDGAEHAIEVIETVWGWLLFGVLASAALTTFVPTSTLANLADSAGAWALVAVLAVSVPLYVCATASVPIAAALVMGGFPTGAALVFLMAGPATNVATIGAVYRTFGRRSLGVYLGTIILGSIGFGLAFDALASAMGFSPLAHVHGAHDHASANLLEQLSAGALVLLLTWFAVRDVVARVRQSQAGTLDAAATRELVVQGMTCDGCANKLRRTLDAADIGPYEVILDPGLLRVRRDIDPARVRELVAEAGYTTPSPS